MRYNKREFAFLRSINILILMVDCVGTGEGCVNVPKIFKAFFGYGSGGFCFAGLIAPHGGDRGGG